MAELIVDAIGIAAQSLPPTDIDPPFVENQVPAPAATLIARTANITFRVDDLGDGVDINFLLVEIDRGSGFEVAYDGDGGGFQANWNGAGSSITPAGNDGFDIVVDPTEALSEFTTISVRINARDLSPLLNVMPAVTYAFTTVDETAPVVSNRVPTPDIQDDSLENTDVAFRVDDPGGSGVDSSTLSVQVRNGQSGSFEDAIIAGVFQAPYNGPSSTVSAFGATGFNIVIDRTFDYVTDGTVTIQLQVEDAEANALSTSWSFSTAAPPNPPEIEPIAQTIAGFPLDMYRFILFEIRRQDLFGSPKPGTEFLKRYLQGPNAIWQQNVLHAQAIPDLWDIVKIADDKLQFLKSIVGWTSEPLVRKVTDAIDDDALRRLIAVSGRLWRTRGPEDAIVNVLRTLTVARLRIWNWFDFRWVLGETGLGEEHDGRDPWLIDLPSTVEPISTTVDQSTAGSLASGSSASTTVPGGVVSTVKSGDVFVLRSGPQNGFEATIVGVVGSTITFVQDAANQITGPFTSEEWEIVDRVTTPNDEYRSNLRIVDNGSLDRTLVLRILRLMRASGERWEVTYLSFLDLFEITGDDLQWDTSSGNLPVSSNTLQLTNSTTAQETFVIVPEAAVWSEYVVSVRMRGTSDAANARFSVQFYRTSADNWYDIAVDTVSQEVLLRSNVGGTVSVLTTVDLNALGFPIPANRYHLYRVSIVDEGATNRIQLSIDGFLFFSITNADHGQGTVGLAHDSAASFEIDEVEVAQVSLGTDTLEINQIP